jgi:hypothetical protein
MPLGGAGDAEHHQDGKKGGENISLHGHVNHIPAEITGTSGR